MKVVILAGGFGSRISFYSKKIPKPMIKIGNIPMLTHIMRIFKSYGFEEFIIAGGYKLSVIKRYYKNSREFRKINIVNTGIKTMTGGRLLKLKKILKKEKLFFLTYGDGVSNLDLKKLLDEHVKSNKIASVTAVRPPIKFGEMKIDKKNVVKSFVEKPQLNQGWINGGFFFFNNKIFDYIKNYNTVLERDPLQRLSDKKQLNAFLHDGYWKCMDNLKEKSELEDIYKKNKSIWKIS